MAAAGRPRADINVDAVVDMRRLGLQWQLIADRLQVHINTLTNWRHAVSFVDIEEPLIVVDDDELDAVIADFLDSQPGRGDQLIDGHLQALGIAHTRQRIRDSVHRVDLESRENRSKKKKKRVEYNVFTPHLLWHMDGWHKLTQKTGIVVHGCIDGASRKCIYVVAADNNSAPTVLNIFKKATVMPDGKFFLPSRVRGDRGGENTGVADFMISARGGHRGSFLVGASWQNQRIEAFWRFINGQCLVYFIDLVAHMTKRRIYKSMLRGHRWVFQYVFLDLINEELDTYLAAWNHHKIRTESFKTPLQLEYLLKDESPAPIEVDFATYGASGNDAEQDPDKQAVVDTIHCELSHDKLQLFCFHVPRLNQDDPKDEHSGTFEKAVKYYYDLLAEQEAEEAEEAEDEEEEEFAAQQQQDPACLVS